MVVSDYRRTNAKENNVVTKKPRRKRQPPPLGPPPPIVSGIARLAGELELKHRNGASEEALYKSARIELSRLTMEVLQRLVPPERFTKTLDEVGHGLA